MGTNGRKRGVNRKREGVQASKKKKAAVEASPSNNRDDRLKAREEAKRQEEATRSESVNGYGRGFGNFLTGGAQPDKTATPVTRKKGTPCANRNCTINGGLADSTHKCPDCGKNIHAICGEETDDLHLVTCPDCKPGTTSPAEEEGDGKKKDLFESTSESDADSDDGAKAVTAVTRSAKGQQSQGKQLPTRSGKQSGGKQLPTRGSVGKTPKGRGKQLSADLQKKIKAAGRKKRAATDAANEGKYKKKRKKYKNGERALMEIRHYQDDHHELLIAKRPFSRLVREVTQQVLREGGGKIKMMNWQATALLAIHTAGEDYLVKVFEAAQLNAIHCKRQTIMPKDMQLSRRSRRVFDDNAI